MKNFEGQDKEFVKGYKSLLGANEGTQKESSQVWSCVCVREMILAAES